MNNGMFLNYDDEYEDSNNGIPVEEFINILREAGESDETINNIMEKIDAIDSGSRYCECFNEINKPEYYTRLTNHIIHNGVHFLIDSCHLELYEIEDDMKWETAIMFADSDGNPTNFYDNIYTQTYSTVEEMIEGHLAILKNPEIIFE